MRTLLLCLVTTLVACDGDTTGDDTSKTPADTADSGTADTSDSGGDTADTSGDTGAGICPTTETAVCGTLKGTTPTSVFAVRMYPPDAPNPAGDLVFDPTTVTLSFPYTYVMPADAFPPDHAAGTYEAVLVIDSDGDGVLKRDVDTSIEYVNNPITIVEGTGLDHIDFTAP